MVRIAAFRPLRYDPERISFISRVVAPPYDVIDATEADALRERDPHNVVRLILGREPDGGRTDGDYQGAAECLAAWRRDGILIRDDRPSVYVCEQSFTIDEQQHVRTGVLCALQLQEFSAEGVLPHEQTFTGPKTDRFRLMSACRAMLSPIFGIVSDPEGRADVLIRSMAEGSPLYEFRDNSDVAHRLWRVDRPEMIRKLAGLLAGDRMLVADGHHRYETALHYRDELRGVDRPLGSAPEDFTVLFCVSGRNRGLLSQPTHRLVKAGIPFVAETFVRELRKTFRVTELPIKGPGGLVKAYRHGMDAPGWIGVYLSLDRFLLLRPIADDPLAEAFPDQPPAWRQLPVALLHSAILGPLLGVSTATGIAGGALAFTQNPEHVYWRVESNRYDVGFLLPPISTATVEEVARAGGRMPQKSTYFWPKIPSGFVIYPYDNRDCLPVVPTG